MKSKKHHKYQYVVICHSGRGCCGIQPLTYEEYMAQLARPNSKWSCPVCKGMASWDDDSLETNPVQPEHYSGYEEFQSPY